MTDSAPAPTSGAAAIRDIHPTPLTPDRPLVVSPSLAARIGLREAVMLHVIAELSRPRSASAAPSVPRWIAASPAALQQAMPWWSPQEIRQVRNSLLRRQLLTLRRLADASGALTAILIALASEPRPCP